ncbi:MAG: GntR family transcriptional regulator [Opitutaceae bacterium]|jgi:DNA-binding GntR family transcriptional regulator|nr:GntR family transcriptional regulator [Opitutaceae bacterium]
MSMLSRKAYSAIHDLIVSGEIPAASTISEAALAKRLRVSRTPVREAVRQLTQEGLLEQIPRRGTLVRSVDRRELAELYHIREALEGHAAGQAAGRVTAPQLAQLGLLVEEMEKMAGVAARSKEQQLARDARLKELAMDKAFHMLILEVAGNRRMIELIRATRVMSDFFQLQLQTQPRRLVDQAVVHHKRILDALRARDAAKASAAMSGHIRCGLEEALQHFDQLHLYSGKASESVLGGLPGGLRKKLAALNDAG